MRALGRAVIDDDCCVAAVVVQLSAGRSSHFDSPRSWLSNRRLGAADLACSTGTSPRLVPERLAKDGYLAAGMGRLEAPRRADFETGLGSLVRRIFGEESPIYRFGGRFCRGGSPFFVALIYAACSFEAGRTAIQLGSPRRSLELTTVPINRPTADRVTYTYAPVSVNRPPSPESVARRGAPVSRRVVLLFDRARLVDSPTLLRRTRSILDVGMLVAATRRLGLARKSLAFLLDLRQTTRARWPRPRLAPLATEG